MTDTIIEQERLYEVAGLSAKAHRATLRKALKRAAIPFRELNGRIFTTQAAIDAALIGHAKTKSSEPDLGAYFAAKSARKKRGVSL